MITDIRRVPSGISVTVFSAVLRCRGCGTVIYNARFNAKATNEYSDAIDGRVRRRFDYDGGNPFCSCSDRIWLSSDDLPIRGDGWPIREAISIECDDCSQDE